MTHHVGADALHVYREEVDAALASLCGVKYSQVVDMTPAMDPNGTMLATASEKRLPAEKFALAFQRAHSLAAAGPDGAAEREGAEQFNLHRAAVIAFGTGATCWRIGTDGCAYLPLKGAQALRLDVLKKGARWGFVVSASDGEAPLVAKASDPLGRVTPPACEFAPLSARQDIGDAVTAGVRLLRSRHHADVPLLAEVAALSCEPEPACAPHGR
jgi:hypothetical protein